MKPESLVVNTTFCTSRSPRMDEVDLVGVLYKGHGNRLQLPEAVHTVQGKDVDAILKGVDFFLFRRFIPEENAAGKEEMRFYTPGGVNGMDSLDCVLLADRQRFPDRVAFRGQLHPCDSGLCQKEGNQFLGRGTEKGVVNDGIFQEQRFILQAKLIGVRPAACLSTYPENTGSKTPP